MTPLEQKFVDSIRARKPICFEYGDKGRNACPYLLGKTADGRVVAHCLSQSVSHDQPWEWRFFYLDTVQTLPYASESGWRAYSDFKMKKTEGDAYRPPAFITEVLAQVEI